MENKAPDKQALDLIRRTEEALEARRAQAEARAKAMISAAREQAARMVRLKEEELAQARRPAEATEPSSSALHVAVPEPDPAGRKAAETIAEALFARITGARKEDLP